MTVKPELETQCPFCKQEHTVIVPIEYLEDIEDVKAFCKHPTDSGYCERAVDSWDEYCWQHSDDN